MVEEEERTVAVFLAAALHEETAQWLQTHTAQKML